MSAGKESVELVNTKQIELFIPILKEIDFGDRFLLSMLHWCEIGQRSTPLDFWQVFLVRSGREIVGVSGLYKQSETPDHVCWLGWFAIRPKFRRQGFGTASIQVIADYARSVGYKELWVYTDFFHEAAKSFYMKLGFELLGSARDYAHGQTMDDSDIVLKLPLAACLNQ
jgi:RimJ/RimL family protein N-acetyltransferase